MAVEMYDSEAAITYAVDIYSFGVILNEIVTGETPSKRRGLATPRWVPPHPNPPPPPRLRKVLKNNQKKLTNKKTKQTHQLCR
jgi:serine/threonine protein kinase